MNNHRLKRPQTTAIQSVFFIITEVQIVSYKCKHFIKFNSARKDKIYFTWSPRDTGGPSEELMSSDFMRQIFSKKTSDHTIIIGICLFPDINLGCQEAFSNGELYT